MVTEPILREGNVVGVKLVHNGVQTSVSAPYIVAADGATSRLRRLMAFPSRPVAPSSYAARRYVLTQEPLEPIFDLYAPVTGPLAGYGWVFPVSEYVANIGIGYVAARGLTATAFHHRSARLVPGLASAPSRLRTWVPRAP